MKEMPSDSIDLIATDPPYDIPSISGGGSINKKMKLSKSLQDLKKVDITQGYDIELYGTEFVRVMKEINIYLWCNKRQIPEYFDFYVNKLKCKYEVLCWHKTNAMPTYSNKYLSDTEYCLYFHKGKGKCFPQSYEDAKTYYVAPRSITEKKQFGHPTIKPLNFMEKIIRNSTKEGATVLDPFMGSGTTGVACLNTERKFIGIEIDKDYFEIAKKRINSKLERSLS